MLSEEQKIKSLTDFLKIHNFNIELITPEHPSFDSYKNTERGLKSNPLIVFKPVDELALQQLIHALNQFKVSAVIFAGNTGLVSAQTAQEQAVIDLNYLNNLTKLSLKDKPYSHAKKADIWQQEMRYFINKHNLSIDDFIGATIECQGAVPVGSINYVLEPAGIEVPIDTGAVTMGGGMSAGAGVANASHGTFGLMHGKLSDLALQVRAINGNGSYRIDANHEGRKIPLFEDKVNINSARAQYGESAMGTQGTFCIITNLKFKTFPIPVQRHLFLIELDNIEQVNILRRHLHSKFPKNLRAYEIMNKFSTELVRKFESENYLNPFKSDKSPISSEYLILAEFVSADNDEKLVEPAFSEIQTVLGLGDDKVAYAGFDADNVTGAPDAFYELRHSISDASTKYARSLGQGEDNPSYNHRITPDVSAPLIRLEEYISTLKAKLEPLGYELAIFGHVGIGSLHLHIFSAQQVNRQTLTEYVFEITDDVEGSCWSEHGIGTANAALYEKYTPKELVQEWFTYKQKNDSNNILNPNSNNFAEMFCRRKFVHVGGN
jgi:FAD/FMN-containing dehydrogenase